MNAHISVRRMDITLLSLLFAAGIFLRLFLLAPTGFDGLYGQDAYAYFDFAGELRNAVSQSRAPQSFFWPLGFPALLAAAETILGTQPATAQAITITMGALLAPLVYVLSRQIGLSIFGALAAAVVMGICGQAVQSSLVIMADIPALFWATLSAILLWAYRANPAQPRSAIMLAFAAFTLAMACISRWLYLALLIPWAIVLLLTWKGRIHWRAGLSAMAAALLIMLPQLAYSRTNPYPVLHHAWVEGWSPANIFSQTFNNVDGHFEYETINALYYAKPFYDAYYLAPFFTPFLLLGLWHLFQQKHFTVLLMLLTWILLPYLFLAGIPYQNIRFPLIVVPAVAILAGCGLECGAQWVRHFLQPRYAYGTVAVVLIAGAAYALNVTLHTIHDFIEHQQEDKQVALWADDRLPEGATIYTFGLTLTLKHYTDLNVHELFYETPATLSQKWIPGQHDYLLLNVWNIEHQWVGLDPQLDYHWLRDTRGLIRLGKNGYYTLYRVKG